MTNAGIEMIRELESSRGGNFKLIKSHSGKEYSCVKLSKCLKEEAILAEPSSPYSLESNGKAERLNRASNDMARSM